MTVFNFFVGLAVVMAGALVGTFHKDFTLPLLGGGLGVGLAFISFVFWKLDQRVQYLIKNAEDALAEIELQFPVPHCSKNPVPHVTQLVRWERHRTRQLRAKRWRWLPWAQYSYAQSFRLVFVFFAVAGVLGTVVSVVRYCAALPRTAP
jgi:hypothetical protein